MKRIFRFLLAVSCLAFYAGCAGPNCTGNAMYTDPACRNQQYSYCQPGQPNCQQGGYGSYGSPYGNQYGGSPYYGSPYGNPYGSPYGTPYPGYRPPGT